MTDIGNKLLISGNCLITSWTKGKWRQNMKLTVPPLEIAEDEGFASDKDIFKRVDFGERLAKLIDNSSENLVLALDSQWGEGKSTFIQMWRGYVEHQREERLKTIYFDAFANDYQKDPFLALASGIYEIIPHKSATTKNTFKKKAGDAAKAFTRGAIKIGVKVATGGLIDGSVVDSAENDISKLISDQVDNIIADRFKSTEKDKLAIKEFKRHLGEVAIEHGNGRPLVFIIDELDRCRPDFALDLIEQIKHLYSVKGITFLIVLNREQLEEYVKSRYGIGVDASLYLQKFINIWLNLPRKFEKHQDHGVQYFRYALGKMLEESEQVRNHVTKTVLEELIRYHNPSYREIERILSYFALVNNMTDQSYIAPFQYIMAFVSYLKGTSSGLLEQIFKRSINVEDLLKLTKLDLFDEKSDERHLYALANYIRYDLSPEEIRNQMIQNKTISPERLGFGCNDIIADVSSWFREININN